MTIIHAQWVGQQAVLPKEDFERLLALARKSEAVDVRTLDEELSTQMLMQLVDSGQAFDFWKEPGEDIYSSADGEPV
jgi:hypothetical protein